MLGNSEIATGELMIRMVLNFHAVTTSSSRNDLMELQHQNMLHQHCIQYQTIICVQLYFMTKWNYDSTADVQYMMLKKELTHPKLLKPPEKLAVLTFILALVECGPATAD